MHTLSIPGQFKAHADGWEINMLSMGAVLSKKFSSSQTFGHFQIRDADAAGEANDATNQQISNNSAINQSCGDGAPGGCASPPLLPAHFSFQSDG